MTPASKFGRLLRSVRKARKLKIWQVAEKVDVEVKHLGRIERGEKKPSFDLIVALAQFLEVSPSKFFEFESEKTDPKALRKRIDQLLDKRDPQQLQRVRQMLAAIFES
ncbi:MAG: helix-turn-helix transcriptional regulator [Candidatus Acidiferrales bacterium]